VIYNFELEFN